MATIPWGTLKSLLIFFGPLVLPKAIAYYRSVKNSRQVHGVAVQPVPQNVSRALVLLFAVAFVFLVKTLPIFSPENLFRATQSRLQIPVDVLFTRLSAVRPNASLTARDALLRAKFVNLESRLLYLHFGPDVLASCPFCATDEPRSYFYYALPALLTPHLLNLAIVTAVTSPFLSGREGASWRTVAVIAAVVVGVVDMYLVSTYDHHDNSQALRLGDLDFFFWSSRVYRNVALATLDGLLGWLIYLSATNRAFVMPPTPAERVEGVIRTLAAAKSKLNAVGIVKNTAIRDDELRTRIQAYWTHEGVLMREIMEEREVIDGVADALENRIDIETISRDAETYAQTVLQPIQGALVSSSSSTSSKSGSNAKEY